MAPTNKNTKKRPATADLAPTVSSKNYKSVSAIGCATSFQRQRYAALESRTFEAAKSACFSSLRVLKIDGIVMELLKNVGWENIVSLPNISYKELTLEFLATLEIDRKLDGPKPHYLMEFVMFGKKHTMMKEEFDDCFGFQKDGLDSIPPEFNAREFWRTVAHTRNFYPSRSYASSFNRLEHFYVHRLITCTVFCRGDSNEKVKNKDLFFLWCMIKRNRVQTGRWLQDHLLDIAQQQTGIINIGAIVTKIAHRVGAITEDAQLQRINASNTSLDVPFLHRARAVVRKENGWQYILGCYAEEYRKSKNATVVGQERGTAENGEGVPENSERQALERERGHEATGNGDSNMDLILKIRDTILQVVVPLQHLIDILDPIIQRTTVSSD